MAECGERREPVDVLEAANRVGTRFGGGGGGV
jgi:hypothetical protein